jgi:arginase
VAFAGAHGGVAWAGVLVAIWGAGSLAGGLAYGSRNWKVPAEGGAMICLALFGALLMLLAAAPGLIALALFMACLGIPLSPWLGSLSASVQRAVPAGNSTEAFAWSFAVITVGMAAGNAISGVVIQSANTQAAFAAAGGLSLAGALLGACWLAVCQPGHLRGHDAAAFPRQKRPDCRARLAPGGNTAGLGASVPPVRLLQAPYDAGAFDTRMGAGPLALAAGAAQRLRGRGHAVEEVLLGPAPSSWRAELKTAFELHHVIADAVTTARSRKQLPLLLSGNCNATLGVLAGLAHPGLRLGLVWLDAHGDFNTPELDQTGSLDGQGLAMMVGRCWRALTSAVPGFSPLPERRVLLIGARSLDTAEEAALRRSELAWLTPAQARRPHAVTTALKALAHEADIVHFHVDLDVYDPSIAPANSYATADGLLAGDVRRIITQTASHLPIASAALASYDPAFDPYARMRQTGVDLLEQLASSGTPIAPRETGVPAHHCRQGHARTPLSRRSVIRPQSARAAPRL